VINLVKIEGDIYSFYEGRNLTIKVQSPNLQPAQLETYRRDQVLLQVDVGILDGTDVEEELATLPLTKLEELISNNIFLYEHVLQGKTKQEWLADKNLL
jgi:hypothetical protein